MALISVIASVVRFGVFTMIDNLVRDRFTGLGPERVWDRVTDDRGHVATAAATTCAMIAGRGPAALLCA